VADLGRGENGRRLQEKRSGFRTKSDAEQALASVVKSVREGTHAHDGQQTVGQFLPTWLETKIAAGLRPTTARSYGQHIRDHLVPHLGHLRLRDLRPGHVQAMLGKISSDTRGPSSVRRVHATLRSALGSAKRQQLVAFNAAADLELPAATRPKVRPWEPEQIGAFLDHSATDRLGSLFEVLVATGLRRGEAAGLRWADVDLLRARIVVRQQLVQLASGKEPHCPSCSAIHKGHGFGPPKTSSGESRIVDLDAGTVGLLLALQLTQDAERTEWGSAYADHGLVFAREDGNPLRLDAVTKKFKELAAEAGMPALTLHGLRHTSASLMLAAGVEIGVVSKRFGHSSISITSDTYSHLIGNVSRDAATRAIALVPRNRRDQSVTNQP
jgi:integrase